MVGSHAVSGVRRPSRAMRGGKQAMWARAICSIVIACAALTVHGAPWLGPDPSSCKPFPRFDEGMKDCCQISPNDPIFDFEFDETLPMRTRRPAHKLDEEAVRKYERAVALMRALPDDDPRSFQSQSQLHCGYAMGAYNAVNSTSAYPIHANWHFAPFHRWLLYFYERILAKLVDDDTLTIPYWAWDVQNETAPPANVIPPMFNDPSSSLYDSKRTVVNLPPARVSLDEAFTNVSPGVSARELVRQNYNILWSKIKSIHPFSAFYGINTTSINAENMGIFELFHIPIHGWVGADNGTHADMGVPYCSAGDPMFFTHHSQTDRMWDVWMSLGGGLIDDPDWLDSEYLFYDENARLVRVKVRDCLDQKKMRTSYEDLPHDWLDFEPTSIRERDDSKYARVGTWARLWRTVRTGRVGQAAAAVARASFFSREETTLVGWGGERRRGSASVTHYVPRSQANAWAGKFGEILHITMAVTKTLDVDLPLYIFLELPEADETTPRDCVEFLGGTVLKAREGRKTDRIGVVEFSRKFPMGDRLRILGVEQEHTLAITVVPSWERRHYPDVKVELTELKLELHAMPSAR